MVGMSRREAAFFLIGLGSGLILAVVAVIEFVISFHHMFIVGVRWEPGSALLGLPFLLVLVGVLLLYLKKNKQEIS
jgi:hypothetical protein